MTGRGPALVIVPMDDWTRPPPRRTRSSARDRLLRSAAADPTAVAALAELLGQAGAPAIVAGAAPSWPRSSPSPSGSAVRSFRSRSEAQAGFPQDHPLFAGHLPARRARLREVLAAL